MISRHHLTKELQWRAIEGLKVRQSQKEGARWLNVSPSVLIGFATFSKPGLGSSASRLSQGRLRVSTSADDRYCHYVRK
ncbi:hypothetical protein TNCV_5129241 [Trichonephila clavipes]|nr:hypothetical protein TNCV_5129241 [Trichonephila clavipes]